MLPSTVSRCIGLGLLLVLLSAPPVLAADVTAEAGRVVSADWLKAHLGDEDLAIIDARPAQAYAEGHIPGAVSLPAGELTDTESVDSLWPYVAAKGIDSHERVVVYDGGAAPPAFRVAWALDYLGHPRVAVLDGGLKAWQAAGNAMTKSVPAMQRGLLPVQPDAEAFADKADVLAAIGQADKVILDVRSPAEFTGEVAHAERGGHIPGAVLLPWTDNFQSGTGLLKPADTLAAMYRAQGVVPDKTVLVHCQSGNRSSVGYWVLRWLGYPKVRNYLAGWSEWGNDPDTPIVQGLD